MAKSTIAICLMFLVASSVIYEVQGTFLLRHFLRKKFFPRRCVAFTPFACKVMLRLVSNLQQACPVTREFKQFFTNLNGYMSYIGSASASSESEMTMKCDGIAKALSVVTGVKDSSDFKETMLSMGKTLIEMKNRGSEIMPRTQRIELIKAMGKWARMVATFVMTAAEKQGKSIDVSSYELDVDANSAAGSDSDSDESTPIPSGSETSTNTGSESTENESPSETPTSTSPSSSTPAKESPSSSTPAKESPSSSTPSSSTPSSSTPTEKTESTSVKQVETETSNEVMSFITELEKKYSGQAELNVFFEKLKSSLTAFATISSKTATDYASVAKSAATKLAEAMTSVGSKAGKSEKIATCQGQVMESLKQLQDINSQIVSGKKVTTTQQTEIKQTISKLEQYTTEFVQVAATSSTSSTSKQSMSKQSMSSSQEKTDSSVGMDTNN